MFVIEAADAMADESQNALLKTLEEPAPYVHLVLISSEPAALLETVRSRCQAVRFAPLADDAVEARLAELGLGRERRASAAPRLGWRRATRDRAASSLSSRRSRASRSGASSASPPPLRASSREAPWSGLLEAAEAAGAQAGEAAASGWRPSRRSRAADRRARRGEREATEAARRVARRARTEALDLGLALIASWFGTWLRLPRAPTVFC